MKRSPLLLAGSLAANIALAAMIFLRTPEVSPAERARGGVGDAAKSAPSARQTAAAERARTGDATAADAARSDPEADARDLALGRTLSRLIAQARTQRPAEAPWWTSKAGTRNREADLRAQRELSDAIIAAFGEDPLFKPRNEASTLAFLPTAKRDALRRIVQDYDEMLAQFAATGVELSSDREKQKLLRAERDRDIAALLSPEELLAYEMRTSTSGTTIKARFGDGIASEDEFARLYALQKAFDDRFPPLSGTITMETRRARAEAERQLQADIAAAVGTERYAALKRAADPELRTIDALTSRLGLAATTADSVVAAREAFGTESQRINADTSLTPQDRRQQITDLAARAKIQVTSLLGAEGAEAYLQRSPWVALLQGGTAYSSTPPAGALAGLGGTNVFPLPLSGGTTSTVVGGSIQQVVSLNPTGAPLMIGGGGSGAPNQTMELTFTSATPAVVATRPATATPALAPTQAGIAPAPANPPTADGGSKQ